MRPANHVQKRRPSRERGIAIVTVLLVVALAATLAASVLWRQRVAIRDVENQRLSVETMWAERAAVEWASATLRSQSATSNVTYDGQPWAAPVSDIQLADFLPRETMAVNGELASAWISGHVEDAQARFNLTNLVSRVGPGQPWQVNAEGIAGYRRLLGELGLNPGLAQITASSSTVTVTACPTRWIPIRFPAEETTTKGDNVRSRRIELGNRSPIADRRLYRIRT